VTPTPQEYDAIALDALREESGKDVSRFWIESDDLAGDILHARLEDGTVWMLRPGTDEWIDTTEAPKDVFVALHVHTKHEDLFQIFRTHGGALRWLANWVHENRYDEMDEHDEGAHDKFEEHMIASEYGDAAELWFGCNLDEYYYIADARLHNE
jgi:hypothetical protein